MYNYCKRILNLLWFLRFSNILNLKQIKGLKGQIFIFRRISIAIHNSKSLQDLQKSTLIKSESHICECT